MERDRAELPVRRIYREPSFPAADSGSGAQYSRGMMRAMNPQQHGSAALVGNKGRVTAVIKRYLCRLEGMIGFTCKAARLACVPDRNVGTELQLCLLYTSPSPRDRG